MEQVENAEELLSATMEILRDKKVTMKARAEVTKRVLEQAGGDKTYFNMVAKAFSDKGKAWLGDNPLELDKEQKHKDSTSPVFIKLLNLITALEAYNMTDDILTDYLRALQENGITITINHDQFEHTDTSALDIPIEEELQSIKSYNATIDSYNDEIRDEHAMKAEELNFAPSSDYSKVVSIYKKGIAGKEIDDDVQDILTHNELLDSAVNLVADRAKEISAQAKDNV